jgi:hypothetical protein
VKSRADWVFKVKAALALGRNPGPKSLSSIFKSSCLATEQPDTSLAGEHGESH